MIKHIARLLIARWAVRLNAAVHPVRRFRVCVLKNDRLGDAVLALGTIRSLALEFGEENCLLIISKWGAPLMSREFPLATFIVVPMHVTHKELLKTGRQLRFSLGNVSCERVVCLRHQRTDWEEILLSWVSSSTFCVLEPDNDSCLGKGSLKRTVYAKMESRILPDSHFERPFEFNKELWRHAKVLELALGRSVGYRDVSPVFNSIVGARLGRYVLVCPFGSSQIRDFPEELLIRVLLEVRRYTEIPIQLHSDSSRWEDLVSLGESLSDRHSLSVVCGAVVGFDEYIEEIAHADLVITVDTATAHLAVALDRKAIVLHGDAQPDEFVPWGERIRQYWLSNSMPCKGCNWRCIYDRPRCITNVSLTMVAEAVAAVLQWDSI